MGRFVFAMGRMAFRHGAFRFPHGAFRRPAWGFASLRRRTLRAEEVRPDAAHRAARQESGERSGEKRPYGLGDGLRHRRPVDIQLHHVSFLVALLAHYAVGPVRRVRQVRLSATHASHSSHPSHLSHPLCAYGAFAPMHPVSPDAPRSCNCSAVKDRLPHCGTPKGLGRAANSVPLSAGGHMSPHVLREDFHGVSLTLSSTFFSRR